MTKLSLIKKLAYLVKDYMMELLNTFDIDYNPTGVTEQDKFKSLMSPPYSLLLNADGVPYSATIKYNYGERWMYLTVKDRDGNTLQGETYVASHPVNLLSTPELRNFGLFFIPELKKFYFYKLGKTKWYNSVELTEEMAYNVIRTKNFDAMNLES